MIDNKPKTIWTMLASIIERDLKEHIDNGVVKVEVLKKRIKVTVKPITEFQKTNKYLSIPDQSSGHKWDLSTPIRNRITRQVKAHGGVGIRASRKGIYYIE
jgi:hypothetical protein